MKTQLISAVNSKRRNPVFFFADVKSPLRHIAEKY